MKSEFSTTMSQPIGGTIVGSNVNFDQAATRKGGIKNLFAGKYYI